MKYFYNICLALAMIVGLAACQSGGGAATVKKDTSLLDAQAFKQKMDALSNELVLDLRTHGELHSVGPIAGARNVDFNAGVLDRIIPSMDKNQPIMLYCASGGRSGEATEKLKAAGFNEVYDLKGGITAWKAAGLPIQAHHHH